MAASGAQNLLGCPQRIAPPGRPHYREVGEIDARGRQRGRVRQVRRREPDDALAGPRKRGERRQHELQLAYAFAPAEELAQRTRRPAAAGKLAIERGEAGGQGRRRGGKRSPAPDRMPLQDLV